MKSAERSRKNTFAVALAWSILAVVGIPMIVFGALNLSALPWLGIPLLTFGCVFTGGGVFAIPLFWVSYGEKRTMSRIVFAITDLGFTSMSALASYMNMDLSTLQKYLNTCFTRGYLVKYYRNGDSITPITYVTPDKAVHRAECASCGATFTFQGNSGECPYCHTPYKPHS